MNEQVRHSAFLVQNSHENTHESVLQLAITESEEVCIAVGFLRSSGLLRLRQSLELAVKRDTVVIAYVGLSMSLSEPDALRDLHMIVSQNPASRLYLCDPPRSTFHPKVYRCRLGEKAKLIVGSANLTGDGLCNNAELSVAIEVHTSAAIYRDCDAFFNELQTAPWTVRASEIQIAKYAIRYGIEQRELKKAHRTIRKELSELPNFDLAVMKGLYSEYQADTTEQRDWNNRLQNYRNARNVLDAMLENTFKNELDFLEEYEKLVGAKGQKSLWHSNGLFRQKRKVAKEYGEFVKLVRNCKENLGLPPESMFELTKTFIDKISGLGVNVATEILNTYRPSAYAVLNENPIGSLRFFGFKFRSANSFTNHDYARYNSLIAEIASAFEMEDLSRVDHFMNYVFQNKRDEIRKGVAIAAYSP